MRYISTRGAVSPSDFEQVLLSGLAADGGLFLPQTLPQFSRRQIDSWEQLSYPELAVEILSHFVELPRPQLQQLIETAYRSFDTPEVTPLVQLGSAARATWVLELFHGPTLSFKDCALQFLGQLLSTALQRQQMKALVLGATSGDTGSAAIAACRQAPGVEIVMLHPAGRVTEMQRRQMTTQLAENVHNLALKGSFDQCQAIVKACFAESGLLPADSGLVAVNSINWCRIMAQTVYYFYAHLRLGSPGDGAVYSVPTGNFGDAYAGYLALRMGLPVQKLVIAVNSNQVLHHFFATGRYRRREVVETLSPSMDIAVASNLERLIYDLCDGQGERVAALMEEFAASGDIDLREAGYERLAAIFASAVIDDRQTCETIAECRREEDYLLDPHSAIALAAGTDCRRQLGLEDAPLVCLATAHPAKFSDAIVRAIGTPPELPPTLLELEDKPERYQTLPATQSAVEDYIRQLGPARN